MNTIPRTSLLRVPAKDRQVLLTGTYAFCEPQPTDAMVFGFDAARYIAKIFAERHDMETMVIPSLHLPGGYCVGGWVAAEAGTRTFGRNDDTHQHARQWCRDTIVTSLDED